MAERNPDLANDFENPRLMRALGLILENQDGFDDLANDFNMRGVPHTLAPKRGRERGGRETEPLGTDLSGRSPRGP